MYTSNSKSKVKVKVKIVNFVFTTGKCQNISTLEDDGKSVWIVMLYYTVLIRWKMMAAAGEREGEGRRGVGGEARMGREEEEKRGVRRRRRGGGGALSESEQCRVKPNHLTCSNDTWIQIQVIFGYSAVSCDWILMSHGRKSAVIYWLTSYSHRGTRQLLGMWGLSQMVL